MREGGNTLADLRDHIPKKGISKQNLQSLITITNEAEANDSVLKTEMINAVHTADNSITLPADATWNDIVLQMPNINASNKRWASGTLPTIDGAFTTGSINHLSFKPSIVIFDLGKSSYGATTVSLASLTDGQDTSSQNFLTGNCYLRVVAPFSTGMFIGGFNYQRISNGTSNPITNGKWLALE